jgi:nucleotide sugar dehydrogenase
MTHINIIGYGYVGSSLGYVCKKNNVSFTVTDIQPKDDPCAINLFTNIADTVAYSESVTDWNLYFVCVPTPNKSSGECDTGIVENVVDNIFQNAKAKTTVFVKSTVQPTTCRKIFDKYNSELFNVGFVPEFLTETRAHLDMYEAKFVLIGTYDGLQVPEYNALFKHLYNHNPDIEIITKKIEVCELFKYTVNVFLATKVWFFNEIYELSEKFGFEYNELRDILRLDPRIGESHTFVPGPDGQFGFGGACLVKESLAYSFVQKRLGIPNKVLQAILERNKSFRNKETK